MSKAHLEIECTFSHDSFEIYIICVFLKEKISTFVALSRFHLIEIVFGNRLNSFVEPNQF